MKTHELLGKECMSFTEWHEKSNEIGICENYWTECKWNLLLDEMDRSRDFLTQPLTPEWVEKYLEGFRWNKDYNNNPILVNNGVMYSGSYWFIDLEIIEPKHISHFFESLPPEIKLQYKNVEI